MKCFILHKNDTKPKLYPPSLLETLVLYYIRIIPNQNFFTPNKSIKPVLYYIRMIPNQNGYP